MHNIERMVEHTFEILQYYAMIFLRVCLTIFSRFMYQMILSDDKRSDDFYRTLKKAVLKNFWQVVWSKKMKNNKRVKVLLKVIQKFTKRSRDSRSDRRVDDRSMYWRRRICWTVIFLFWLFFAVKMKTAYGNYRVK